MLHLHRAIFCRCLGAGDAPQPHSIAAQQTYLPVDFTARQAMLHSSRSRVTLSCATGGNHHLHCSFWLSHCEMLPHSWLSSISAAGLDSLGKTREVNPSGMADDQAIHSNFASKFVHLQYDSNNPGGPRIEIKF